MEKHIIALEATNAFQDDDDLEDKALEMAIEEIYEGTGKKWKPWAKNARSMRIGDIVLLVDSDTVVPEVSFFMSFRRKWKFLVSIQCFFSLLGLFQGCCA